MPQRRSHGEGSVFYDASRKRWVGLAVIGGHRRKVSGRTKREATEKLRKLIHAGAGEADGRLTVGQTLAEWFEKAVPNRNLTPQGIEGHRWAVGVLTAELGRQRLANLRPNQIEQALERLAADGLTRWSLVKLRSTLNLAMSWAVKRRVLAHNPVAGVEIPVGARRVSRERVALTRDEIDQLVVALQAHELGGLLLLCLGSGLRPGEASAVCPDALDLDERLVVVERAVRTQRGVPYLSDDLKTKVARRIVEIDPVAIEPLRLACDGVAPGDLLYTSKHGGPIYPSTVRAQLKRILADAGLPQISPNELRHSFATAACEIHPPHVVADALGHASTRMVDATYRHRPPVRRASAHLGSGSNVRHLHTAS